MLKIISLIKTIWRITMTIRLTLQFIIKNLLFLIFVSISFSAYSQELRLKFSHVVAPDTPKGIAAKHFADSIKKIRMEPLLLMFFLIVNCLKIAKK